MATTPIPARPPGEPPTVFQTSPNRVQFDPKAVVPSQPIYLQRNDQILLIALSNGVNIKFNVGYRYLTPEGEIKEGSFLSPPFTGIGTFAFELYEGWLLSFSTVVSSAQVAGQWLYLQAILSRGSGVAAPVQQNGLIWEGYIPTTASTGWPGAPSKEFTDGAGFLRSITGSTPAAGAEINEVVPSFRRWTLLALRATLTTSATVANRFPGFVLDDGANILYFVHSSAAQAASLAFGYDIAAGNPFFNDTNNQILIPFPSVSQLKVGFRIRSSTPGLQATDQWSAPQYLVAEWGFWDT